MDGAAVMLVGPVEADIAERVRRPSAIRRRDDAAHASGTHAV